MALLFIDGFDDGLALSKGWNLASSLAPLSATGRFGGSALQKSYLRGFYRAFPSNSNTIILGFAAQPQQLSSAIIVRFGNAGISMTSTGAVSLIRADTNAVIATASTITWPSSGVWRYLELKTSPTSGVSEIRVDGVVVVSGTVPTVASATTVTFPNISNPDTINIDDLYVIDTTGTANNTYLGDVRVQTLLPSGDGSNLGMTPSAGTTHYSLVNEATPDTNTHVSTSSTGIKDSYQYQDLAANTASIYGVAVTSYASKDAPATASISTLVRLGATDYINTTPQVLSASWTAGTDLYATRPSDGAPWTPTDVNSAEFGIQAS